MGNISILLADDSITIQKVVGIIFAGDGYTLTVVDSGAAAVQKAQELLPDVLLIDVLMPGMNGYEVCEQVRAIPALATKPILLLTGSFEAFDAAKAKSCGADDHITKPFESHQIIAKVQELYALGQRRAAGGEAPQVVPAPPAEAAMASFVEPTAFEAPPQAESFGFEPTAFETNAFETNAAFETSAPAVGATPPAASPDDPWGTFTQPAPEQEEPLAAVSDQTDVPAMIAEEPHMPVAQPPVGDTIGASWVPVEEQTFEFQEEVVEPPAPVFEQPPAPVMAAVEPVQPAAAPAAAVVAPAAATALTEAQLKEALLSVSKETIERIVWEVVPDLAESLIKETIRRITEGK